MKTFILPTFLRLLPLLAMTWSGCAVPPPEDGLEAQATAETPAPVHVAATPEPVMEPVIPIETVATPDAAPAPVAEVVPTPVPTRVTKSSPIVRAATDFSGTGLPPMPPTKLWERMPEIFSKQPKPGLKTHFGGFYNDAPRSDLIHWKKMREEYKKWVSQKRSLPRRNIVLETKLMTLTITSTGDLLLKRNDTGEVLIGPDKPGSIRITNLYKKSDPKRVEVPMAHVAEVRPGRLLLWSEDNQFHIMMDVMADELYCKIQLLYVSNNNQLMGLDNNWPGHLVEFESDYFKKPSDDFVFSTLRLNPMSILTRRMDLSPWNLVFIQFPFVQYAQTDDRPQPQGAIAMYASRGFEEHDEALKDIWVKEPSLPRPLRAHLKRWTHADVDTWIDSYLAIKGVPEKAISFTPNSPESLYGIVDVASETGFNLIRLHNTIWQGKHLGSPNQGNFPNGFADVDKWTAYRKAKGVDVHLHGFGALSRFDDPVYGRGKYPEGLATSAEGTLVKDVAKGQKTFLVKPDFTVYPWQKPGMPPAGGPPWGNKNSGYGNTFPPYMEGSHSHILVNHQYSSYTYKITPNNLWEITIDGRVNGVAAHKAGDRVRFLMTGRGNWLALDPRSDLFLDVAEKYSNALNHFEGNDLYDGAGWSEHFGGWTVKKMSQLIWERLGHHSERGGHLGKFERHFRKVTPFIGRAPRGGSMPVVLADQAIRASSLDKMQQSLSYGARVDGVTLRGNHSGIRLEYLDKHGLAKQGMRMASKWVEAKNLLSDDQRKQLSDIMDGFYQLSETPDQWQFTKAQAMRREGFDAEWQVIPERPYEEPRQFLKADAKRIEGLNNPFAEQVVQLELHVMAAASANSEGNIRVMPKQASDIVPNLHTIHRKPPKSDQQVTFQGAAVAVSYDNSGSNKEYKSFGSRSAACWSTETILGQKMIDTSKHRGLSVTVEGDGSGAQLVLFNGPHWSRSYLVDIDFTGVKTFEIPNGEAIINRADWDPYKGKTITAFNYGTVGYFGAFFHRVPAGKQARVKILDLQCMAEDQVTGLINPVIALNKQRIAVQGTIPFNHYLVYQSGDSVKVYDENWHFINELPVSRDMNGDGRADFEGLTAMSGDGNRFGVSSKRSPQTWISSRLKVIDSQPTITVGKKK